ncbi:MAG TPA: cadherin-like domain-containing protein [Burkholderiales bacterium]|nr:cadherin-like domain-containing protein [Burkholderiales bacterium]
MGATQTWWEFAMQQMAAESYLDQFLSGQRTLTEVLVNGNNNQNMVPDSDFRGQTRFVSLSDIEYIGQKEGSAQAFAQRFLLIDHHSNDSSGFSTTFFKDLESNSYTLSFRSTEFRSEDEGGDRPRDVLGADEEMALHGFSFAQLLAMENYYEYLRTGGLLPADAVLNVTGYSLGGHLATVFTELHSAEVNHTYTFNSPGRGGFNTVEANEELEAQRIAQMLARLKQIMLDPDAGLGDVPALPELGLDELYVRAHLLHESDQDWNPFAAGSVENIYSDPRYEWAKSIVISEFSPDSRIAEGLFDQTRTDGAFTKITQIVGHATHGDSQYVASSQYHPPETRVFIEDQPDLSAPGGIFGLSGDFGTTHSITLIVDSLALQSLYQSISPNLTQEQMERIFAASSAQRSQGILGVVNTSAEGDSLENALLALYKTFGGDNDATLPYSRESGGFGNLDNRTQFYDRLNQTTELAAIHAGSVEILPIVDQGFEQLVGNATAVDGSAYRYALRELIPLVVVGLDYSSLHDVHGELDIYDPATGSGALSNQWIEDRAAMFVALTEARLNDSEEDDGRLTANTSGTVYSYSDPSSARVTIVPDGPFWISRAFVTFAGNDADAVIGQSTDDHLYGEEGNDSIHGAGGADWLEGGSGDDLLNGGDGGDWLWGGNGNDQLNGGRGWNFLDGGSGLDVYTHEQTNKGFDFVRDGSGTLVIDGLAVTGGQRIAAGSFTSLDRRFEFSLEGSTLLVNGTVAILDFQNGDLGIVLEGALFREGVTSATTGTGMSHPLSDELWGSRSDDYLEASETGAFQKVIGLTGQDMLVLTGSGEAIGGGGADYLVGSDGDDQLFGDLGGTGPGNSIFGFRISELDVDQIEVLGPVGWQVELDPLGQPVGAEMQFRSLGVFSEGGAAEVLTGASMSSDLSTYWNDIIEGGAGNDWIDGGVGSDRLFGGDGNDFIDDGEISGAVLSPAGVYRETYRIYAAGSNDDYLDGGAGDDRLTSHGGNDWLVGGDGNDVLYGAAVMEGGEGDDILSMVFDGARTPAIDAWMFGGDGDDYFVTGKGSNVDGGMGQDIILVNLPILQDGSKVNIKDPDGASVLALSTTDIFPVPGPTAFTFARDGEDLIVLLQLSGISEVRWEGWFSAPESGAGVVYAGGLYRVSGGFPGLGEPSVPPSLVVVSQGEVLARNDIDDRVIQFVDGSENDDIFVGSAEPVAVRGREGNDNLTGGAGNDFLDGGDGNDTLDGGTGTDRLFGGKGDDIYVVGTPDALVIEGFNGGTDTVQSTGSYVLPNNVESLVLIGEGAADGTGNYLDNLISGNAAANTLDGGGGNDTLVGGSGGDIYLYGLGYGSDLISDAGIAGDIDRIQFVGNLNSTDVALTAEGDNLVVTLSGSGERLIVEHAANTGLRVEELAFADTVLGLSDWVSLFPYNLPPTLEIAIVDQSAIEDVAFAFQVPDNTFSDESAGRFLSYKATLANGVELPSWLHFDAATRTFEGIPGNADVGSISVEVTATDEIGASASDVFDIAIANTNDAPAGNPEGILPSGTEDVSYVVDADLLLAGFEDADGDVLSVEHFVADHGSIEVVDDHAWTIHPDDDYNGPVSLEYEVVDGNGGKTSAVRAFDLVPVNDAPVAGNDIASTIRNTPVVIAVRVNDSDPDGDPIVVSWFSQGANGSVAIDLETGDLKYAPKRDFAGVDSFSYQVSDGQGGLASATVSVAVSNVITGTEEGNVLAGTPVGDVLLGLGGNDSLFGSGGDDQLEGGSGNDTLDGGAGVDRMFGGAGNDTYVVDGEGDVVEENALEGTDTVRSQAGFALGANVENLVLLGFAPISGTGNELANKLTGNAAANVMSGGAQGDILEGGAGDDLLDGGEGEDSMSGGAGNDTYVVDSAGDAIVESAGRGNDTIRTEISLVLGAYLENLVLSGSSAIDGTGNDLDNELTGNSAANILKGGLGNDRLAGGAGNDVLIGGPGSDRMIGGLGDDFYVVDSSTDVITEDASEGADTVQSDVSWVLGPYVENLLLEGGHATFGFGNFADNLLIGNAGENIIFGNAGDDILQGREGNDSLVDVSGKNLFDGGAGDDWIAGGSYGEMFIGGAGNDTLRVGSGADVIAFNAGDGQDRIDAGAGADDVLSFGGDIRYSDLKFSKAGTSLVFEVGNGDQITFRDWYAAAGRQSVGMLQVVAEAMSGFDPGGGDPLLDNKVETFDFTALVRAFDDTGRVNDWSLTNALLSAHLSGSDTEALGGDLAYQYGMNGTLGGIGLLAAQDILKSVQFGNAPQSLRPSQELLQGQVRL